VTRRTLLGTAAAAAVSLGSRLAPQDAAPQPAPRVKGPRVWLDMDQQELDVQLLAGEGYNHFEILETLANPYGLLGRAVLAQMKLG
jgi:hypothetical protein